MGAGASIDNYSPEELEFLATMNFTVADYLCGKISSDTLHQLKKDFISQKMKREAEHIEEQKFFDCTVCRVSFKNKHSLDRHLGFSTIHASNLLRQREAEQKVKVSAIVLDAIKKFHDAVKEKQIEEVTPHRKIEACSNDGSVGKKLKFYRVVYQKGANLRSDVSLTSHVVKVLRPGTIIASDEQRVVLALDFCEVMRVHSAEENGWVSYGMLDGTQILEEYQPVLESVVDKKLKSKWWVGAINRVIIQREIAKTSVAVIHHSPQPVIGDHCLPIFSGCKMFWRTQTTLNIHMILHMKGIGGVDLDPHVIEIIPFDLCKRMELKRLYLDYAALQVDKNVIREFDEKRRFIVTKRHVNMSAADIKRDVMTKSVLERLDLEQIPGQIFIAVIYKQPTFIDPSLPDSTIDESTIPGPEAATEPVANEPQLLISAPKMLMPMHIDRSTLLTSANAGRVSELLNNLETETEQLKQATANAEERSKSLTQLTVNMLIDQKKSKKLDDLRQGIKLVNNTQMRWMKAIEKVVIRQSVDKTRLLLISSSTSQSK